MMRTQPGGVTGKGTVTQDKYNELMNWLFAMIPKMRTLKRLGRLGEIFNTMQKAKIFV